MLISLQIEQVAVIEKVVLEPPEGFLVLSGETGAGKSMIIDSMNMVLGGRASKDLIRTGADKAKVQALFAVSGQAEAALEERGIACEDGQVLISRELYRDGRSVCRVNGELSTAGAVKGIAPMLLNIHGQHDNQMLLQNARHIDLIDGFAGNDSQKKDCRKAWEQVRAIKEQIGEIEAAEQGSQQLLELYRYQIEEIEQAELRPGEEEELRELLKKLEHAETVSQNAEMAYEYLYGAEGAHDALSRAAGALSKAAAYDKQLEPLLQTLEEAEVLMDDAAHQLRDHTAGIEQDEGALDRVQSRLETIRTLERKYGATEQAVLDYYQDISQKVQDYETSGERLEQLNSLLQEKQQELTDCARKLTETRRQASLQLEQEIMAQLAALDMKKMRFFVQLTPCEAGAEGAERAVFLLASNPGEELKELSKIASGGELSRIMLALKSVLADADPVGTLIFDEIDAGVSGRAAQKIAEKLYALSKNKQVICITHLPQIAAMADGHYLIEKQEEAGRAVTRVIFMNREQRLEELARMIGGVCVTDLTTAAAGQMLEQAEQQKNPN